MPKISIIVPVYNVEKYLENCINTILKQSFTDFELLLIDDGSTDASSGICDRYQEQDARIRVRHQSNQGVSAARNLGLSLAQGDYIYFVDSDDYLHERLLEQLYGLAEETRAEVTICGFKATRSLLEPTQGEVKGIRRTLDQTEAIQDLLYPTKLGMGIGIWNKLFRRDCLAGLRFAADLSMNEDKLFVCQAFGRATRFAYTSQCLYFYYYRPESTCRSKDYSLWLDCVRVGEQVYQQLCHRSDLEIFARYQLVDVYYYVFNIIVAFRETPQAVLWELQQKLGGLSLKELSGYLSCKQKLSVLLIKLLPLAVYRLLVVKLGFLFKKH